MRILVLQTAFIGDVILTLPVFQALHQSFPDAIIDGMVVPRASNILEHHPSIHEVISYDKRGNNRGILGAWRIIQKLRARKYDIIVVPHRSLRSALIARLSNIPRRIGFDRSVGSFLLTDVIAYRKNLHEIERNLSLLKPLLSLPEQRLLPILVPTSDDVRAVEDLFRPIKTKWGNVTITVAPGTVWNTKRWPKESFTELAKMIVGKGMNVVLVGGKEDALLCEQIAASVGGERLLNAAGRLTLRQTAAMILKSNALVSNDSAPMHLAAAVGIPVVAIFGATAPSIGFGPSGPRDIVVEVNGLSCRPCSLHGTEKCPIGTFQCMLDIAPHQVFETLRQLLK
jgi:heptosyltransferase-2